MPRCFINLLKNIMTKEKRKKKGGIILLNKSQKYMIDHENFKGLSEQLETTMGASTRIFKQLNSKAIMGFDNITDMLRLRPFSIHSSLSEFTLWQLWCSKACSVLPFGAIDGPKTFAGSTALTLHTSLIQES